MEPKLTKLEVLEIVVQSKKPVRVKTHRKYIKIDVDTADTILGWWGAVGRDNRGRKPHRFPSMSWLDLIAASKAWAVQLRK